MRMICLILLIVVNFRLAYKVSKNNEKLMEENKLLKKTMVFVRSQLFLTRLKECPEEEKTNIVREMIEFIDEIEKVW